MSQRGHQGANQSRNDQWRGAGPYPLRLEPVAMPGDHVYLDGLESVRPVQKMLAFPEVQALQEGVTVAANDSEEDVALGELEMPTGQLGQFRMMRPGEDLPEGIEVTVDYGGREAPFYQTNDTIGDFKNDTGTVEGFDSSAASSFPADSVENHLLEWYVMGTVEAKRTPLFTFTNTTAADVTVQNVGFSGFIYKLGEPLDQAQVSEPIPLPVRAWGE